MSRASILAGIDRRFWPQMLGRGEPLRAQIRERRAQEIATADALAISSYAQTRRGQVDV